MIQIEQSVPIPAVRRLDANRITPALQNLIQRYTEAYQRVYGIKPTVTWQNPWLKIAGNPDRVSRSRLLEMARQLEYRVG